MIAVTAFAMQGDRARFLVAGFDGYMGKPIEVRAFGPEVESFLAGERPPLPGGAATGPERP